MQITLKAARANKGLTQEAAGKLIGVSACTIGNWERGDSFPDAMQILKIQSTYGVKYDDIIFLPENSALSVTAEPTLVNPMTNTSGKEDTK
jgi:transcriptional regulator with XRE-family HTH domain